MQKALSKKSQNNPAQKRATQKKVAQRHSGKKREDVIILKNVWKIFGLAAEAAMLSSVQLNTSQVNGMVYALSMERMDAKEFAQKWVMENKGLVDSWFR